MMFVYFLTVGNEKKKFTKQLFQKPLMLSCEFELIMSTEP